MRVRTKNTEKSKIRYFHSPTVLILILLWLLYINWYTVWYMKIILYICIVFSPFFIAFIFITFSLFYKELKKYFDYSFFQKVSDPNMALKYIWNNNFLNHHNYYKNHELEHKYFHYIKVSELKIISPFFFIFIIWISLTLILLKMFWQLFFIPIFIVFIVMFLVYGDQKPEDIENKLKQKIYFRKIKPTTLQKIKNKIFFY